jgi:hypothetical protein
MLNLHKNYYKPISHPMKTSFITPVLALFGLLVLNSCDEDLFDVTETFTFEHEFVVYGTDDSFLEFASVNLSEKETLIEDYGSKIKKIEILEVKYHLKAHQGSEEQKVINFNLYSSNPDGTDEKNIVALQNVVLHDLLFNPTVLNVNSDGINKLAVLIEKQPHTFGIKLEGQVDETPVDFTVVFSFRARMTANPLN